MNKFEQLEAIRKKCPQFIFGGIATIVLGLIFIFLLTMVIGDVCVFLGFIAIITGSVLIIIGSNRFSKVAREFKDACMQEIIDQVLPNAQYSYNMGIPLSEVYKDGLLKRADRAYSEDLITGNIKGVSFKTCDLKLEERRVRTDSKGNTTVTYVPYFIGRYFVFDFNKNFKGDIVITEGMLPKTFRGLKKIELESEEFNKKFKTYAVDDLSAFYVLTPHLMVSLLELEKNNPGCISISMNSNKLCMAINNNRDTFSVKLNRKIDNMLVELFKAEMNVINEIVDEMNLNNKIFKEVL